jgi:rhodanese-related sulfurtransferase
MRRVTVFALGLIAAFPLVAIGCGKDDDEPAAAAVATTDVATSTGEQGAAAAGDVAAGDVIIIDVRTPEEYAQGHLEGAINLDVESGDFEAGLADLDPAAAYSVYCRSGRRSAIAADVMAENGFTEVTDLGSLESAAATTGLPVTTD